MNKKTKQFIIGAIAIILITFIAAAFIKMDINPYNWDEDERAKCVAFGLGFVFCIIPFFFSPK